MPSVLAKRIMVKEPARGDIIVVRMVQDHDRDYVASDRVAGRSYSNENGVCTLMVRQ